MSNALLKTIIALDNMEKEEIFSFLQNFMLISRSYPDCTRPRVKVGMEAFYRYGRNLILELHQHFHADIFLDLKLHDIPNTVKSAIAALADLPVSLLTIHLAGGRKMCQEAQASLKAALPQAHLLGVTYLTSLGPEDFSELWNFHADEWRESFLRFLSIAQESHLGGVVLSAQELPLACANAPSLLKVCPGIRFADEISAGGVSNDQKRAATPADALGLGADFLVMGRSLTQAHHRGNLEKRVQELWKTL